MRGRADDAGPNEQEFNSSKLIDSVLALLEEAGVPTDLNDRIVRIIEEWEWKQEQFTQPEDFPPDEEPAGDRAAGAEGEKP